MTAKEYLEQYRHIKARVEVLQEAIEQLRTEAESVSINLDGMPHSQGNSTWENLVIKLSEYETELQGELSMLWSKRMDIIRTIGMLESQHQTLLTKRYIDGKRWEQIAVEMHFSWRHCHRVHGRALTELEKIING